MHYKNGEKAQIGDVVIGTTYNRTGKIVGIMKAITSASEKCNCTVSILATVQDGEGRRFVERGAPGDADYSDCGSFDKVI